MRWSQERLPLEFRIQTRDLIVTVALLSPPPVVWPSSLTDSTRYDI
jgi:hypothetical protein